MNHKKGETPAPAAPLTVNFPEKNDAGEIVIRNASIGSSLNVTFTNNTGDLVRLWIPRGELLFVPPSPSQNFNDLVLATGHSLALSVLPTPTFGTYAYHVFCSAINDYARGGSPPQISCP